MLLYLDLTSYDVTSFVNWKDNSASAFFSDVSETGLEFAIIIDQKILFRQERIEKFFFCFCLFLSQSKTHHSVKKME